MKYREIGEYETISEKVSLVQFDEKYSIEQFDCGIDDYNQFLIHDAKKYIDMKISSVHLLMKTELILFWVISHF